MRSGPIQPEVVQERIDRREEVLSIWEQGNGANIDLPWAELNRPDALNDVKPLVTNARSVVLAIGATATSRKLIDAILQLLPAHCRLYVYGDCALEADAALIQRIAGMGDRVLVRLGYSLPADWLIVDKGRDGRLVVGATAEHRKWVIPISDALARSLFEAFCVLFWFHATREALPDANGNVAFRPPLKAPFNSPCTDISLPAGRLRLDGDLDDPVPDAEIRISPNASDPGRARVLFIPPTGALTNGLVDLDLPTELCLRGHQVLWVDTGLPRTTVTLERMVMDLVEAPIALQIEWPSSEAITFYHSLNRMAQQPDWEFHPARRLDAVKGKVLLDRATQSAKIVPSALLDAGKVDAPLLDFDSVRPDHFPDIPALALEATVRWQRVPVALPAGAHPAEIVRRWTAVDEWATRTVASLRDELNALESQEGLLNKLFQWLPSRDGNLALKREQLRDELDEIGESPPSRIADQAKDIMRRLTQIAVRLDELRRTTHNQQQDAEDAKVKKAQRDKWARHVEDAKAKLNEVRQKLATNEEAQGKAEEKRQELQATLDNVMASKRQDREASLDKERVDLEEKLDEARTRQKSLKAGRKSRRTKASSKKASRQVRDIEQALARNKRDLENIVDWSPPASELGEASARLKETEKEISTLRSQADHLSEEDKKFNRDASEEFRFEKPPRLPAPSTSEVSSHPPIPSEAPPEIGDLYEHRGERFLAIRTWEQLSPAEPVAKRLQAKLVVASNSSKA